MSAVTTRVSSTGLLIPAGVGAAVALTLGVYGNMHGPTGIGVSLAGFSSAFAAKAWLATGAVLLALVQLASALVLYGKVPGVRAPSWTGTLHRWSGRAAFLLATPIAVHCLYAAGFARYDLRTAVHSTVGCFFFGAFTVKMLILPRKGVPGWALPVAGGLVFTALVVLWLSSAFWFFTTTGVTR
jgi:hypothetical protein